MCPDCDKKHQIFGESKIDEVAAQNNLKVYSLLDCSEACYAEQKEQTSWH